MIQITRILKKVKTTPSTDSTYEENLKKTVALVRNLRA